MKVGSRVGSHGGFGDSVTFDRWWGLQEVKRVETQVIFSLGFQENFMIFHGWFGVFSIQTKEHGRTSQSVFLLLGMDLFDKSPTNHQKKATSFAMS